MSKDTQRLSVLEKAGYSLGDLAANLIFQTLMMFLAYFYTDIYGLPPAAASTIILVGGFFGACFNIIMGPIADRTKSKWGKFRPWVLFTSVPFALSALLAFTTPDFGETGKIVYAFCTFIFLMIMYSMNNLPYSALSGVLTGNMKDRNSLSSYRFVAVQLAILIVYSFLMPFVNILGDGDQAVGFAAVIKIFAISGVVMLIITFLTTKERIVPKVEQVGNVKQDFSDLIKNRPWIIMLSLTILVFIGLGIKVGVGFYYFDNFVSESHTASFLYTVKFDKLMAGISALITSLGGESIKWESDVLTCSFSLFNALGTICGILGIMVSKPLADKFGKRDTFIVGLGISSLFVFIFFFFSSDNIGWMYFAQIMQTFFYGITIPLLWAMIADVADYSEWKNNRRATAVVFAAMLFGLKVGMALGQAFIPFIISCYGYDAKATIQSAEAIHGIKMAVSLYGGLPFAVGTVILFFYKIDKKMELQLEADLAERRAKN